MQDESILADRIGAPISARLAELQSAAAASNSAGGGGLSAVPDLLFGNKDFLDEFLDVSDDKLKLMIIPLLNEFWSFRHEMHNV